MYPVILAHVILLFRSLAIAGGGTGGTSTHIAKEFMTCSGPDLSLRFHYKYDGFTDYYGNVDYVDYYIMDVKTKNASYGVHGDHGAFMKIPYKEYGFPGKAVGGHGIVSAYLESHFSKSMNARAETNLIPGQGGTLTVMVRGASGKYDEVLFSVHATDCKVTP